MAVFLLLLKRLKNQINNNNDNLFLFIQSVFLLPLPFNLFEQLFFSVLFISFYSSITNKSNQESIKTDDKGSIAAEFECFCMVKY